ncbi:MAG TPA: response regulator [Candidatus Hydrogenedens sp.]|nr:response regulator [Candidatus Hydrogenedens sp.]HOK10370.1 response regulator [Candidatus Hydrogenedens sp.]HOL20695.1 response regulator [Candidatus Hydrogenedens sp.]HPP59869.1 response regulator [Candidatus Hydrogenedens sp.]
MQNIKILFADDSPELIRIFKQWAEIKGFNAKFATNGVEVLETIKEEDIDLIVLDIDMPILDGIRTAEEIQKITGKSKILILTGLGPNVQDILPENIVDVLLKPISLKELGDKISEIALTVKE